MLLEKPIRGRRWGRSRPQSAAIVAIVALVAGLAATSGLTLRSALVAANLISNPSCATSTAGWTGNGATVTTSPTSVGAGCLVSANGYKSFAQINDFPGLKVNAAAGTVFTAHVSIAAKAASAVGKPLVFALVERNGSTLVGMSSTTATLTSAFATLTVSRALTRSGDLIAIDAYQRSAVKGDTYFARTFSLSSGVVSSPTPTPSSTPTASASPTPQPTATPTATVTPAPSATPTPTATGGGAGDGTIGALTFAENFVNPTKPLVNTTGFAPDGVQACNFGFPAPAPNCGGAGLQVGGTGKWFGNWYPANGAPLPALAGTTNYAELDMNVPGKCGTATGGTQSCRLEAIDHGGPHISGTWEQGQTTYESGAVYVPSGGLPGSLNAGYKIGAYHFENVMNGEPIQVGLFQDHINLWGDMGACVSKTYCQYHIKDDDNLGSWPAGSTYRLPAQHIIPSGAEVKGAWNEYILKVKWESDNTGTVDAWYRSYNGSTHTAWAHSVSLTGIATVQYLQGGTPSNTTWNDNPLFYGPAVSADTPLDEAGFADATGFAAAASAQP